MGLHNQFDGQQAQVHILVIVWLPHPVPRTAPSPVRLSFPTGRGNNDVSLFGEVDGVVGQVSENHSDLLGSCVGDVSRVWGAGNAVLLLATNEVDLSRAAPLNLPFSTIVLAVLHDFGGCGKRPFKVN